LQCEESQNNPWVGYGGSRMTGALLVALSSEEKQMPAEVVALAIDSNVNSCQGYEARCAHGAAALCARRRAPAEHRYPMYLSIQAKEKMFCGFFVEEYFPHLRNKLVLPQSLVLRYPQG